MKKVRDILAEVLGLTPVTIVVGRYQPVHKGHQKLFVAAEKTGQQVVVIIVKGKKSSEDIEQNPFSFENQRNMIKAIYPDMIVIEAPTAWIGSLNDKLKEMGMLPTKWVAGGDRVEEYQKMIDRAKIDIDLIPVERDPDSDENISGTKVRAALKNNDKKEFERMTPKEIHPLFNKLKGIVNDAN